MKRALSARFGILASAAASALVLAGCMEDNLESAWPDREISIDRKASEWAGREAYYSEQEAFKIGFFNDAEYLYVYLATWSRQKQMQILTNGLTVWIDGTGKKRQTLGINYPLKHTTNGGTPMRRWRPTVRIAAVLIAGCATAAGQPMSGTFTVGGSSPSFPTLQAAANALKARGLGGPVTFNIRPGTYSEGGGTSPVLILDGPVAGQGPANRITLQADPASGGNETNTFLAADQTAQTSLTLAQVKLDYVTIRRLSFVDADSGAFGARELLRVTLQSDVNQTVEGFVLEDCIFSGNPAGTDAGNNSIRRRRRRKW